MSIARGTVRLGSDVLLASGRLRGARVGIVCNPASVGDGYAHVIDRLRDAEGVRLGAIFGPQHGFRSDVQDNMIETPHRDDPRRQVPVYSLYSETREPTADMLRGIDVLVIDLQDVGARIYTYVYTMANCLRAAARHGVPVIVCDRPNPIGGLLVEGACLEAGYESFVGQFAIPMRHGMTIGELALLFNAHFGLAAPLEVVDMEGWRRDMHADETGLPWVMPSPNMPTLDTALVYPGTVLFEGTMLSEGRGTTRPFELVGAPWIDAEALAARMNDLGLPGVHCRPAGFEPTFQKHARQYCGGCQLHVTDRAAFRPVLTGASLITELRRCDPDRFAWRQPPYEYEHTRLPIDILAGSTTLRTQVEDGASPATIAASWAEDEQAFSALRASYLRY
ncbi:MAG: exo-beta-N-acetylmuramidase NamZ domain-containing protein [Vicinamibacterales bacterium]